MTWLKRWFGRKPRVMRQVRFYTRDACPLCVAALATLRKYAKPYRLNIEVIDIALDPQLESRYGHEIPVVFIDGKRRFFGHVDPALLLRIIDRPPCESE